MNAEKRLSFFKMTSLITTLNSLNFSDNFDEILYFEKLVKDNCEELFILPSGCIGNVLALALEMHLFKGALHIIVNAEKLGIDMINCSHSPRFNVSYTAKQVFEYSVKDELYLISPTNVFDEKNIKSYEIIKKVLI